jgi:pimeloyl-ACP methyl ester carboxylesterase
MLDLLAHLGRERTVWVGHDWGSPVVWSVAAHPERCQAVANLCVPYIASGFAPANLIALVNREIYPEATCHAASTNSSTKSSSIVPARLTRPRSENTIRALFRKGNPAGRGQPARSAEARRDNGWFGGADRAPSIPRDPDVISEEDLSIYTAVLARTGFFGPDSWYMNAAANIAYAGKAKNEGKLALPVLFLHGAYDYTCETIDSRLAEPIRRDCADLTEVVVPSGHWMAQERPIEVNAALTKWLAIKVPDAWPT